MYKHLVISVFDLQEALISILSQILQIEIIPNCI